MAGQHCKPSVSWTTCAAPEHFPSSIVNFNQKGGRSEALQQQLNKHHRIFSYTQQMIDSLSFPLSFSFPNHANLPLPSPY
jgi:hypothetical protein